VPPRCGRRQYDLDTSLDDEWIVRIGHAPHRIGAAEIRRQFRTEEFGRRSAHDRAEIMDQMRLIRKAAGICDIGPAQAAFPHGDNLFDPCQPRILFRADPVVASKRWRPLDLENTALSPPIFD